MSAGRAVWLTLLSLAFVVIVAGTLVFFAALRQNNHELAVELQKQRDANAVLQDKLSKRR